MRRIRSINKGSLAVAAIAGCACASATTWAHVLDPTTLDTVNVRTARISGSTEGQDSYLPGAVSSALGLPMTIQEIPQSVTVITRQHIDDQQLEAVGEILSQAAGISSSSYDYRSQYYARGFLIDSFQYDGVPTTFVNGAGYLDAAFYDRVELVRGSTGLLSGPGNPSASVNLVRKRPTAALQVKGALTIGSWDTYGAMIDVAGPLTADQSVRGRIIGNYQDTGSFTDRQTSGRRSMYATADADLGTDTLLTVGYEYMDYETDGMMWGGLPLFMTDGSRAQWSVHDSLSSDWTHWSTRFSTGFARVDHSFTERWKLSVAVTQSRSKEFGKLLSPSGFIDAQTSLLAMDALAHHNEIRQTNVDVMLSGSVELFSRTHDIVAGAMSSRRTEVGDSTGYMINRGMPLLDVASYRGGYPEPAFASTGYATLTDASIRQSSVYSAARMSVSDRLSLVLGGRLTRYDYRSVSANNRLTVSRKFTPYAGLVYDLDSIYSVYASYTSIFSPQLNKDATGSLLAPAEGDTMEVGLKANYFSGRLITSLALFQADQDHVAQRDPLLRAPYGSAAYYAVDGTRSRGVEFDLQGDITPRFSLYTGGSYFRAVNPVGGRLSTTIPRGTAKLFAVYRLPTAADRLKVGAGVNWQSRFYQATSSPMGTMNVEQSAYAVVSLMAAYKISERSTVNIGINNVLDKRYSQMIGFYGQENFGAPRNASITVHVKL